MTIKFLSHPRPRQEYRYIHNRIHTNFHTIFWYQLINFYKIKKLL